MVILYMPKILNQALYDKIKKEADAVYRKPSAYKSGYIVRRYKEEGGTYGDDNATKNLKRWFKEEWKDIGGLDYPVYRPTKRISKQTPLTTSEIDPEQAKEQIKLKQKIKGTANLPPFKSSPSVNKAEEILNYSNPQIVRQMADHYIGKDVDLYYSSRKDKKYMVQDPTGKWIHFGTMKPPMEDYTKHLDERRRDLFRRRNHRWASADKWTPAFMSYYLLW